MTKQEKCEYNENCQREANNSCRWPSRNGWKPSPWKYICDDCLPLYLEYNNKMGFAVDLKTGQIMEMEE